MGRRHRELALARDNERLLGLYLGPLPYGLLGHPEKETAQMGSGPHKQTTKHRHNTLTHTLPSLPLFFISCIPVHFTGFDSYVLLLCLHLDSFIYGETNISDIPPNITHTHTHTHTHCYAPLHRYWLC